MSKIEINRDFNLKCQKSDKDKDNRRVSQVVEGNTNSTTCDNKKKQDNQYKYWQFTEFKTVENLEGDFKDKKDIPDLYIEKINQFIKKYLNKCEKWYFGLEKCPTTNNYHLQGFLSWPNKGKRYTEIKKIFDNGTHFERCKGNEAQNIKYCGKDGLIWSYGHPVKVKVITELYPWQKVAKEIIEKEINDRHIYWFYDDGLGNLGKSQFIKWVIANYEAILITGGKKSDLINMIFNEKNKIIYREKNIVVIDIPKNEYNNCSYSAIEEIKNGLIANTKFEGGAFIMNSPHIIICSNFYPNIHKVMLDRWQIYKINKDKECEKILDIQKEFKKHYVKIGKIYQPKFKTNDLDDNDDNKDDDDKWFCDPVD